jgi:AcrR family transcriptional regulator
VLLHEIVRDSLDGLVPDPADRLDVSIRRSVTVAVSRPYLRALWSREVRIPRDSDHDRVRALLRSAAAAFAPAIRRERPDLTAKQAELLACGVQSVLSSVGRHAARVSGPELTDLLSNAALALCQTQLHDPRPALRARRSSLQPFSRRERLLVAATRLFAERGYHATAMADIGAAADVTGPNLYGYFDSKATVLRAVIERGTHGLWLDLDDAFRRHRTARDALCAVVAAYVRRRRDWEALAVHLSDDEINALATSYQREYVREWIALLRQSRPDLTMPAARVLVHAALTVINDLNRTPDLAADGAFADNLDALTVAVLYS